MVEAFHKSEQILFNALARNRFYRFEHRKLMRTAIYELPRQVLIPPRSIVGDDEHKQLCWRHLHDTAAALPIDVAIDAGLAKVCWSAFEFAVDGVVCVYDFSDFLLVDAACHRYQHWLRTQYVRSFFPHVNLDSFPPIAFFDWPRFHELSAAIVYDASGDVILHKQIFPPSTSSTGIDLRRRRSAVQAELVARFGAFVDTAVDPQEEFWHKAGRCLVSVHVPGSHHHSLDRGQHQLMGLGVCTLSPEIWTATLAERPQRDVHYVGCRDDYSDLPERIEWCRSHRKECVAIGRRAKEFFLAHSTPEAIWRHIKRRIDRIG